MKSPSCRLFVIPARDVPLAVILRRGPSKWYHLIMWDMQNDTFTEGAWIKGRIYEERCDLSPDGKLFVYFVHQGNRSRTGYTNAWIAVSRPPWLHALTLWPQGSTWGNGGRFVGNRQLIFGGLNDETHPDHPLRGIEIVDGYAAPRFLTKAIPESDWCGNDHYGKVIYTTGGKLFRRTDDGDEEIADFTNQSPDPQPPPEWTMQPLEC